MPKNQQMSRDNSGKPKLSYMLDFPHTSAEVANVLEMGAEKYARNNWKKGAPMTETEDSLMRHLLAFHNGEDLDEESGMSHLAHVICNAQFLLENYYMHGGDIDDRDA